MIQLVLSEGGYPVAGDHWLQNAIYAPKPAIILAR